MGSRRLKCDGPPTIYVIVDKGGCAWPAHGHVSREVVRGWAHDDDQIVKYVPTTRLARVEAENKRLREALKHARDVLMDLAPFTAAPVLDHIRKALKEPA